MVMDQTGRSWIIFQVLLPNERAWTFKWIFQEVLPNMLGMEFLMEVEIIITDGDSQQTTQLDLALNNIFPMSCDYDVDGISLIGAGTPTGKKQCSPTKQERRLGRCSLPDSKLDVFLDEARLYCHTEEELNISKALFIAYIRSEVQPNTCLTVPYSYILCFPTGPLDHIHLFLQVPELIGESHVADIFDLYKAYVEVHESFYAFWLRKFICHFDKYNNCSHEGTNGGMKM
jgi:hypothetical protein